MSNYGVVGYGTYYNRDKITEESLTKFVKRFDPNTYKQYQEDSQEDPISLQKYIEMMDFSLPGYISEIITEKTEISTDFTYDGGLFFPLLLPWEMNDKERALSSDDFKALLSEYLNVLTPDAEEYVFGNIVDEVSLW